MPYNNCTVALEMQWSLFSYHFLSFSLSLVSSTSHWPWHSPLSDNRESVIRVLAFWMLIRGLTAKFLASRQLWTAFFVHEKNLGSGRFRDRRKEMFYYFTVEVQCFLLLLDLIWILITGESFGSSGTQTTTTPVMRSQTRL